MKKRLEESLELPLASELVSPLVEKETSNFWEEEEGEKRRGSRA